MGIKERMYRAYFELVPLKMDMGERRCCIWVIITLSPALHCQCWVDIVLGCAVASLVSEGNGQDQDLLLLLQSEGWVRTARCSFITLHCSAGYNHDFMR